MNKVFSTVWNAALEQLVVASELARGKTKGSCAKTVACTMALAGVVGMPLPVLGANYDHWVLNVGGTTQEIDSLSEVKLTADGPLTLNLASGEVTFGLQYDSDDLAIDGNQLALSSAVKTDIQQGVAAKAAMDKGLTFEGDSGSSSEKKLGDTVEIIGGTNITTAATTDGVQVKLDPDLEVASVKTSGNLNVDGSADISGALDVTGVLSVHGGLDMDGNKITHVGAGSDATDAVNKGQLDAVADTANAGWTLNGDSGSYDVKPNKATTIAGGTNIETEVTGSMLTVKTVDSPEFGGIKINDGGKITGVTGGTISATSDDVVTGRQIYERLLGDGGGNPNAGTRYFHVHSTEADSQAIGDNSIAIGPESRVDDSSESAIAMGVSAVADINSSNSIIIGTGAQSEATTSISGSTDPNDYTHVENSIAVGTAAKVTNIDAVAMGHASQANGEKAVALGKESKANGESAVSAGDSAEANDKNTVAVGTKARAGGENSLALGARALTQYENSVALGNESMAKGHSSVAVGDGAQALMDHDVAIGLGAGANSQGEANADTNNVYIGVNAGSQNTKGGQNVAIGDDAGKSRAVNSDRNVAIGAGAGVEQGGKGNIAIGYNASNKEGAADVSAKSVTIGYKADVAGNFGVALGPGAVVQANSALALGRNATVTDEGYVALGSGSRASLANSHPTGGGSLPDAFLLQSGTDDRGSVTPNYVLSIGRAGSGPSDQVTRRITNVAGGYAGTDAVNVDQLKATRKQVADLVGGDADVDASGYDGVTIGSTHYSTIAEAIADVNGTPAGGSGPGGSTYVQYNGHGGISNVDAAQGEDDAVNLGQMKAVIDQKKAHYFSVNSTGSGNRGNDGATGADAIAIGLSTSADHDSGVALGNAANSESDNGVAIGTKSHVYEDALDSISIGHISRTDASKSLAMGSEAVVEVTSNNGNDGNGIAMGTQAYVGSTQGTAVGNTAHIEAGARQGQAFGFNARVNQNATRGVAIGSNALAGEERNDPNAVLADAPDAYAIGTDAHSQNDSSYAIGRRSLGAATDGYAIGTLATTSGTASYAIGHEAHSYGTDSMALGTQAKSRTTNSIAFGHGAEAGATGLTASIPGNVSEDNIAIGSTSNVQGNHSIGVGAGNTVGGTETVSGTGTLPIGNYAGAFGNDNMVKGDTTFVVGNENQVADTAVEAGAFGISNSVSAEQSFAFGNRNQIDQGIDHTFVLGSGVQPTQANSVVLGNKSTDRAATEETENTFNGIKYSYAGPGSAEQGVVSVGAKGEERQVINVAAGEISDTSTDAVNGSQLYATDKALGNLANSTRGILGGNAALGDDGTLTMSNIGGTGKNTIEEAIPASRTKLIAGTNVASVNETETDGHFEYTIDADGSTVSAGDGMVVTHSGPDSDNVTDYQVALSQDTQDDIGKGVDAKEIVDTKGLTFTGDNGSTDVEKLGDTVAVNGDNNISTTANGDAITVALNKDLTGLDSITFNDGANGNTVSLDKNGLDNGGNTITNVGDGAISSSSTDAINGSQLQAMGDSLAGDVLGGNAQYDGANNQYTMSDIGGTGEDTIDDAIKSANTAANAGWKVADVDGNSNNIGPNGQVTFDGDSNITVTESGNDDDAKIQVELNDDIDVNSVTAGNSVLNTDGLTVDDGTNSTVYGADGLDINGGDVVVDDTGLTIANGPSVTTGGIDAGDQAITGVGDGAISSSSDEAINGSQLQAMGDSLAGDVLGGNAEYDGANNQYTMTDIGGTGENTIDDAIKSANTAANAGWTVADAHSNSNNIGPNGQVTFNGDSNITVTESGSDDDATIEVELSDDIDVNSVTSGNSVLNTNGLTVDDGAGNTTTVSTGGTQVTDGTNTSTYGPAGSTITDGTHTTTVGPETITMAGGPNDDVSLGNNGLDNGGNTITGVADGAISTSSDEAINGSQLQAMGDSLAGDVLGGDATYDGASNSWDMGNDIGGTGQSTIDEAIASTNDAATAGWNLSGDGSNQINIGPAGDVDIAGDSNISIAQSGSDDAGQIDITLNKNIDLGSSGSVTTGNSVLGNGGLTVDDGSDKTEYGADGLTIAGGPSVTTGGIDAGNEVISNVADGAISSSSSEAINGSQLQAMGDSLAGNVLGGDANYDGDTNSWDMGNDIGGTGQSTIDDAIASANDAANAGWDLTAQGNNSTNVGPGDSVDLNNSDGNIAISKTGTDNDVTFDLADEIDVATSVTVGDSTLNTNGLTVDDGAGNTTTVSTGGTQVTDGTNTSTYGPAGSTITDGTHTTTVGPDTITLAGGPNDDVSLGNNGLDNGGNTITGVDDGAINSGSTDAINGSQLQAGNDSLVGDVLGGDASYDGDTNSWDMGNDIGGTGQSTIDDAIASANDAANAGWDLTAQGNNSTNVGPGDSVDLNNSDGNVDISKTGTDNDVTFDLADEINVATSVTVGDSTLDTNGLTIDDGAGNTTTVSTGGTQVTDGTNTSTYGPTGSTITDGTHTTTVGPETITLAGGPNDDVSLGNDGLDNGGNTITGVDDGAINSGSTDAINGSQLQAGNDSLAGDVLGGDANYDGDTNSWDMGNDIGGTGESTVDDAIASANTAANAGWDLTAQGNNSTNVGPGDSVDLNNSDGNIAISKTGTDNDVTFDLADEIDVATSVTVGDSVLDTNGLTVDDGAGNTTTVSTGGTQVTDGTNTSTYGPAGSTITDGAHTTTVGPETITLAGGPNDDVILGNDGLDNGGNTITGVADGAIGSNSDQAINGSQLYALGDSAENILGGDAEYDTDTGELSMSDIGGTGENNINDAIKQADSGWTITDGANNDALIKHGKVTFTGDSNIAVEQTGTDDDGQIEIALNKNVDLGSSGSVTIGGTVMNNDGLTTGNGTGPSITSGGIDAADTKITNVQDGTVAADSKDAVNGGQLYAAQDNLTTKGLDFTGNDDSAGTVHRELGQTLAIKGGNVTGGSYSGDNLKTVTDPTTGSIELQLADNPEFDSVVTGNSTLNNEGLKVSDGAETTMVDAGVVTVVGSGGTVSVNGDTGTVNGLTNQTFDPDDYTSGQAATEDQLNAVYEIANSGWTVADASGNSDNIGPGGQVTFDGDDNVTVSESGDDDDAKVQVALNDDINVVSVTTGDPSTGVYSTLTDAGLTVVNGANPSGTTYGADGMRIANGPSVTSSGVDAGGQKVTNVKAGDISANSTDAVNGSQLHQTNQDVSDLGDQVDNITNGAGGMFQVSQDNNDPQPDPSGDNSVAGGAGATASGDNSAALGNDSLAEGDQSTALGNASEALGDDSTALGNGAVASKDGSTAVGQGSQASGDNSTALGQDSEATGNNSVALGQGSVADEDNVVSVGSDGNERKVTHVADGEVSDTSTDAVNGSQLQAVKDTANAGWNLTTNGDAAGKSNVGPNDTVDFSTDDNIEVSHNGNNVKFELADDIKVGSVTAGDSFLGGNGLTVDDGDGNVTQTTATGTTVADGAGNTTVINAGGTTVSSAGGDSTQYGADGMHIEDGPSVTVDGIDGGGQKISNVAPGTADSDVATVGQLHLRDNDIKNWSKNYTDMRFNQLGRDMHDLDRDLRGGVASAMAMASLPQAYQPGQSSAAAAVSNYRGESGLAIGLSTVTDSGHYVFKLNLTGNTRGDFGVGAGAAIMW